MSKITLILEENLITEIIYELKEDEVEIQNIELQKGNILDFLNYFEDSNIISILSEKINEALLLDFNEIDYFSSSESDE